MLHVKYTFRKPFVLMVSLLFMLMTSSCTQDWLPHNEVSFDTENAYALSFRFSVLTPQTRASETEAANNYDPLNENAINNMVVILFENGNFLGLHSTVKGDLVLFPTSSTHYSDP